MDIMSQIRRCELSDLPVEMCDHCEKGSRTLYTTESFVPDAGDMDFYRKSDRPGKCVCGQRFSAGDTIGWDTVNNWWRAEKCCG